MTLSPRHYHLVGGHEVLPKVLGEKFVLIHEAGGPLTQTYCDTFDWRLSAAGWQLIDDQEALAARLKLVQADSGALVATGACASPSFFWDFPPGPLRSALEPVIEMRALLPMVCVRGRQDFYRVLDRREKTVVRLEVISCSVGAPGAEMHALLPRLILDPLKGFQREAQAIAQFLEKQSGLVPLDVDLFSEGLAVLGRSPGDYSSKVRVDLSPATPAAEALRQILWQLLETLLTNQAGVEGALDSEFLHDFRVAVRRTRSALGQIKGVLPAREVVFFRQEFSWLGSITGSARDFDVYLLDFPRFQASLPPDVRDDLQPFRRFLLKHQQQEYRKLCRHLASNRYRKLIARWRDFLQTPGDVEASPGGTRPVVQVAAERTWKVYRRVMREGLSIRADSPPEDLHELRKTCKKLRYLMEFFQSLYPPQQIRRLIKALKELQDNLGTYQDLHVQVDTLRRFSHEMAEEAEVPAETLLALGRLVEALDRRQVAVRHEFSERFAHFTREKNQLLFRQLFKLPAQEQP